MSNAAVLDWKVMSPLRINELEYINHLQQCLETSTNHMFCYYSYHFITYFHIYMGLLVSLIVSFLSLVLWKYNIVLMTTVFLVSFTVWKNKTCHLFELIWKCLAFHSSMWLFRTALKVPPKKCTYNGMLIHSF